MNFNFGEKRVDHLWPAVGPMFCDFQNIVNTLFPYNYAVNSFVSERYNKLMMYVCVHVCLIK